MDLPTPNPNILPEAFEDDDEKNDFEQLLISSPINDINFWADLIKKNQKFFQLLLFWTVSLRMGIISIKSQIRSMNIDNDVFSTEFLNLIPALVNMMTRGSTKTALLKQMSDKNWKSSSKVISICGPTRSGKSTIAKKIVEVPRKVPHRQNHQEGKEG